MKIIYALEAFFPHLSGVTIVTNRLATYFGRLKDCKVWVITTSDDHTFKTEKSHRGYTIIRLPAWSNPIRKGFKVSYLATPYIKKILVEIEPDIIHLQDPGFVSQALAREAKKKKIPIIISQHSNLSFPAAFLPKCLRKWVAKIYGGYLVNFLNRYCQLILTPTETMKKDILSWGVKRPVTVISNGINLRIFKPGRPNNDFLDTYHLRPFLSQPIVLYSGRLDKDKNLTTLLKAIPLVLKSLNCYFIFLGKGELQPELEKQINEWGLNQWVKFIGPVKPNDRALPEFYQLASLFVMPSAIEAQSLVTMEAMACGLPIVASRSGALPELVKDKENGLLVDPYNPEAFSQAIIYLLRNEAERKKMAEKSLEFIKDHDLKVVLRKLADIYEKIVS